MLTIETVADWQKARKKIKPVKIKSKTQGEIAAPCMTSILCRPELVIANTYNPNSVSDEKMLLLQQSILDNGFCFPIVTIWDEDLEKFVVIDGFHRTTIGGPEWLALEYVPIVVLSHSITQRMTATIQFNKARGVHQVDLDAEVIRKLIEQGQSEEEIADKLKIDLDTVHRYKQVTGIAELFRGSNYSQAWEIVERHD